MIVGTKKELKLYKGLHKGLERAIDYVLSLPEEMADGAYAIDGEALYATVMSGSGKTSAEAVYESHKKYMDLQYVLKGSETVGYAHCDKLKPVTPYEEERDICFLEGEGSFITLQEGEFYIVYPFDAHAPCLGEPGQQFQKIVVKIKI